MTCFNCNEKGNYKSEYPKHTVRMARISFPKPTNKFKRQGAVNRWSCSIILDSGVHTTAIPSRFIPESQCTGKTVNINMANSQLERWKLAKIRIEVEESDVVQSACVIPKDAQDVLLGADHHPCNPYP